MSLTVQDQKSVRTIVREETSDIRQDVGVLKIGVSDLQDDMGELKYGVSGLRDDVEGLKYDVLNLHAQFVSLDKKADKLDHAFRGLGVQFEDFGHKMDAVAELVTTTVGTRNDVKRHDREIKDLQTDMVVVKAVIKQKP